MTTSADIRDYIATLLVDELGTYYFEGAGAAPAIALLHKGEPATPRKIKGLECIVFAIPQRTQRNSEFEILLKFWANGRNNYNTVCDLIQNSQFPLLAFNNLAVKDPAELMAVVVVKITYPITFIEN